MEQEKINRVKRKYEKFGCVVLKIKENHNFIDLVAIYPKRRKIIFIRCEPKSFSKKEKESLEEKYDWINDEWICNFVIE